MLMSLLAEEIVEEWLNRQGFFTIRGIKIGVQEIDLLALRVNENNIECRHIEVTASITPMSYISNVPLEIQKATGRAANSRSPRTTEELRVGVNEWIEKKFNYPKKIDLRQKLYPGSWSYELVVNKVFCPEELNLFREAGIKVLLLTDLLSDLKKNKKTVIEKASGASLVDLIFLDDVSISELL